jgi:hypothetical protein
MIQPIRTLGAHAVAWKRHPIHEAKGESMRQGHLDRPEDTGMATELPHPAIGSRWRWATSRKGVIGGSVVVMALGLGSVGAGAATSSSGMPSHAGAQGQPPPGMGPPTASGQVTALSGDTITIRTRDTTSETVTFTSSTTFRTRSLTSTAAALKVGDFVGVLGTKNSDGSVTATSIVFGTTAPGPMGHGGRHPGGPPPRGAGSPPA